MSNRLRFYREEQKMSQVDLALKSDVKQTTISSIERGTVPTLTTAHKLAKALGIKTDDLLAEEVTK